MIHIQNLTKTFNPGTPQEFTALRDITFDVGENELVLLKGVSGSGKSTLLAIVASMLKPTSGEVIVEGKHVAKLPDLHASRFRATTIGFIFQSFNLLGHLSVADNVSVPLIPLGLRQKEIDQKVERALRIANIVHKKETHAHALSGGEKQRCAIARALVSDPKLILCDEPTANLDRENALVFVEAVKDLKKRGYTLVIATHDTLFDDLAEVDQVIRIENGVIL